MIAFAIKPPLQELGIKKRPPPEEDVVPNSSSICHGEEFPIEWNKHLAKLKKKAEREANVAAKASNPEAGPSTQAPKQKVPKKKATQPKPKPKPTEPSA